jgi:transcriptional regulator with XRE-family HTH domain
MSAMKDTLIRNPEQLGRAIRLKRLERAWSQNTLAARLGVDRKWIIHIEAGNSKAEFGLVLKLFSTLGLTARLQDESPSEDARARGPHSSRLDDVFRRLQRPERK